MTADVARPPTSDRGAGFEELHCNGNRRNGDPCNKVLLEVGRGSHYYIRKRCERCATMNVYSA